MSPTRMAVQHRWIYLGALLVLVALLVAGILTFHQVHRTNAANRRAAQLNQQLVAAGFGSIDQAQIARTLGSNGAEACDDPDSTLRRAQWLVDLSNGADGPGQRPVIVNARTMQAGEIVIQVYCPSQLPQYRQRVNQLKTGDTVQG
ncbi:hypothetical protein GXW82_07395 [Streptacidiphilus sp. 4-A2]|nr:hypothetical protein [Streptacidiphilus sp. 4-A2]